MLFIIGRSSTLITLVMNVMQLDHAAGRACDVQNSDIASAHPSRSHRAVRFGDR